MTRTGNWALKGDGKRVEVRELPLFHVAYARSFGDYYGPGLYQAWYRLMAWAFARGLAREDAVFLGVAHDDPEVTPPERCRYDACLVVGPQVRAEADIGIAELPSGPCAMWNTEKRAEQIAAGWDEFFCGWLPDSGFEPDSRPIVELYASGLQTPEGKYQLAYCIPVRPLQT